jgi:hypothetical protein
MNVSLLAKGLEGKGFEGCDRFSRKQPVAAIVFIVSR